MRRCFGWLALFVVFVFSQANAAAQTVGRTEIKDLPEGWTQLVAYDKKGLVVDGGQDDIPMKGGAFLNRSLGMLMVVDSSSAGHGRTIRWVTMKCPPSRIDYFTNDYGSNQTGSNTRCLVINARYASKTYIAEISPPAAQALEKEGLRFDKGQMVRAWSGVRGGSYLKIYLLKTTEFNVGNSFEKDEFSKVSKSLIAFGESMQQLVYDATLSLGGNLSLQLLNSIK
jgi:hypothetical protein